MNPTPDPTRAGLAFPLFAGWLPAVPVRPRRPVKPFPGVLEIAPNPPVSDPPSAPDEDPTTPPVIDPPLPPTGDPAMPPMGDPDVVAPHAPGGPGEVPMPTPTPSTPV